MQSIVTTVLTGRVQPAGDALLVLAEDDNTYSPLPAPVDAAVGPCPVYRHKAAKERILFVGWR